MSTEIIVRGQARDRRAPDRANVYLDVNASGRDRVGVHTAVADAVAGLMDTIKALSQDKSDAVTETSVSQASQSSWKDKGGQIFSETVSVRVTFADFIVMSRFLFDSVSDVVQLRYVDWSLSPQARDEVRSVLGAEAVRDARVRADIFAQAAGLTIVSVQALADPGLLGRGEGAQHRDMGMMRSAPMKAMAADMGSAESSRYDLTPQDIETETQVEARFLAE